MKRDQFGRDVRKLVKPLHVSSDVIRDLHFLYMEEQESTNERLKDFIERVGEDYGLSVKGMEYKTVKFQQHTPEQIEKHNEWKRRSQEKALNNLKNKPKKKIKQYSEKGQKRKQEEDKAMREFWKENENEFGACVCAETGIWLHEYSASLIHHIFSKGSNESSRTDKENFIILCFDSHQDAEKEDPTMKTYEHMQEVRQKMKLKYARSVLSEFDKIKNKSA